MIPVAVLNSWYVENKDIFVSRCNEHEFDDSGRGSAEVTLETERYIVSLCAWDHNCCLDIQVLEIRSEESNFLHTGECPSIAEFKEHLNRFSVWFNNEAKENA